MNVIRDNIFVNTVSEPEVYSTKPLDWVEPTFINCTLSDGEKIIGRWDENGDFHKENPDE